jgi:uncharacterized membrane protein
MLTAAKFTQFILGILSISFAISSITAKSTMQAVGVIGIAIALIIGVYMLQKYIAKKSTVVELKNYRLENYQAVLGILTILQLVSLIYGNNINSKIVHAILFIIFTFLMIAIEKRKAKNKRDAS